MGDEDELNWYGININSYSFLSINNKELEWWLDESNRFIK
jgi:hypothetical protein